MGGTQLSSGEEMGIQQANVAKINLMKFNFGGIYTKKEDQSVNKHVTAFI